MAEKKKLMVVEEEEEAPKKKKMVAEEAPKKKMVAEEDEKPKVKRERKPRLVEGRIKLLVEENPKRGAAEKRFDLYNKNKTVKSFLEAGGTRADLSWDVAHKFIEIKDAEYADPTEAKPKKKVKTEEE